MNWPKVGMRSLPYHLRVSRAKIKDPLSPGCILLGPPVIFQFELGVQSTECK